MYCSRCGYNNAPSARTCINCELDFESPNYTMPGSNTEKLLYAGFWTRFLANILDLLVLGSCMILLILSIAGLIAFTGGDSIVHNTMVTSLFYSSIIFMSSAYFILMEAGAKNATLGKHWMNIKVMDSNGNRLTIARTLWRLIARLFSYLPLGTGFLLQPFTARKQALHDLVASTVVVQTNESKKISIMATVVVLFVALMVPLLAIFATAGLPVFQQYVQTVQLDKGLKIGKQATVAVARFYRMNGRVPAAIGDAGGHISPSRHVAGIDINQQNGELVVSFSMSVRKSIRNKHLIYTPVLQADNSISWKCHSNDIEARILPDSCR
jgi:uncharacterized RDD family membrane protein YckC